MWPKINEYLDFKNAEPEFIHQVKIQYIKMLSSKNRSESIEVKIHVNREASKDLRDFLRDLSDYVYELQKLKSF